MRGLILQQLDEELKSWKELAKVPPPRNGWLREIREALGMKLQQLGNRVGVSHTSILALEKNEREGTVTLNSLKRVADALNCELVYALVPRIPLSQYMTQTALEKARHIVHPVSHSMSLEGQATSPKHVEAQINDVAQRIIRESPGELWD